MYVFCYVFLNIYWKEKSCLPKNLSSFQTWLRA